MNNQSVGNKKTGGDRLVGQMVLAGVCVVVCVVVLAVKIAMAG